MKDVLQLFGYLILTFLGALAPLLILLLSVFRDGISILTTKYEQEKKQSSKNIQDQLANLAKKESADLNVSEIEKTLKERRAIKKVAENKLNYLDPKRQALELFLPLFITFGCLIVAILCIDNIKVLSIPLAIGIIAFLRALFILFRLVGIIVEIRKAIDDNKNEADNETSKMSEKIIELLSALVKNEKSYFLEKVFISVDDMDITAETKNISIPISEKKKMEIWIRNSEPRMAKNIEVGFILPPSFIVEKGGYKYIWADEQQQIVRYELTSLQGNTYSPIGSLTIIPTETGEKKIKTFIKAENIESTYRDVTFSIS